MMAKEYVKGIEGAYRIGDTRVSLDSLVYLFREGMSAESMVESYSALSLELTWLTGSELQSRNTGNRDKMNAELIAKLQRARHAGQVPG